MHPFAFANEIPAQQEYPVWLDIPGVDRDEPGRYFVIRLAFADLAGNVVRQAPIFKKWAGARNGIFFREITDMTEGERDALLARFGDLGGPN